MEIGIEIEIGIDIGIGIDVCVLVCVYIIFSHLFLIMFILCQEWAEAVAFSAVVFNVNKGVLPKRTVCSDSTTFAHFR